MAEEPILPLALLANPTIRLTSLIGLLLVMLNIGVSVYVPLFLELARGMGAGAAGLVLIAPMISVVGGALIAGQYMRFVGRFKLPPLIGVSVAAVALWTLGQEIEVLSLIEIVLCLAAVGMGLGTGFPTVLVVTQNAVEPRDLGIATASHIFFRSLGGAIGVALFAAIILGMLHSRLGPGGGIGRLRRPDRYPASGRADARRPAPGRCGLRGLLQGRRRRGAGRPSAASPC